MKKSVLLLSSVSIFLAVCSFNPVAAQDKTKEDKEKEMAIQKAIDEQKKAMVDKKKAREEAMENLQKTQEELDSKMKDIDLEIQLEDSIGSEDPMSRPHVRFITRSDHFKQGFPHSPIIVRDLDFTGFDSDNESTSWEFSKSIIDKSLKNDYTFEVEKTSKTVVMSVNGDCKAGEIRVKIVMPNGKTYSDVVIDEFGNLDWRKSFNISETENQDKTGSWKFIISSNKASGYFKISLQAY
jgi:hypothetical protein